MEIRKALQQRKMLVRMSEKELTGAESIEYWDKKAVLKKGDLEVKQMKVNNVMVNFI